MRDLWISPSGASLFEDCHRAWGYRYVARIKSPDAVKPMFGTLTHEHVENWLVKGEMPKGDTMPELAARSIIRDGFLPTPGEGVVAETRFRMHLDGYALPVVLNGVMDFGKRPTLMGDTKTTSSAQYMLTEETFFEHPQPLIYSAWAMKEWNVNRVTARWLYIILDWAKGANQGTPGVTMPRAIRRPKKLEVEVSRDDPRWVRGQEKISDQISEMARTAKATWAHVDAGGDPLRVVADTLEPTGIATGACQKYGGCFFASICPRSPSQILRAHDRRMRENSIQKGSSSICSDPVIHTNPLTEDKDMAGKTPAQLLAELRKKKAAAAQEEPEVVEEQEAPEPEPVAEKEAPEPEETGANPPESDEVEPEPKPETKEEKPKAKKPKAKAKPKERTLTVFVDCAPTLGAGGVTITPFAKVVSEAAKRVEKATGRPWAMHEQYVQGRAALVEEIAVELEKLDGYLLCYSGSPEFKAAESVITFAATMIVHGYGH